MEFQAVSLAIILRKELNKVNNFVAENQKQIVLESDNLQDKKRELLEQLTKEFCVIKKVLIFKELTVIEIRICQLKKDLECLKLLKKEVFKIQLRIHLIMIQKKLRIQN